MVDYAYKAPVRKAEVVGVPANFELVPRQEVRESRVEPRVVLETLWAALDMFPVRLCMYGGDEYCC